MKEDTSKNEFFTFRRNFGRHLQEIRKRKGMSQEELASKIGIDRVSMGYIEQGIRSPKLRTIFLLSKELSIDIKELFEL